MKTKKMKKILISFVMILFLVGFVSATEYYVATDGNNNNPGTEAQPWLTLTYAANTITNGDTVIVRGGTYQSGCIIRKSNVTFQNYLGETPIIDGDGVRPGPEGGWGTLIMIQASGADLANNVALDGFEIRESSGYALQVDGRNGGTDNVIIKNCQMIENYRMGIVIGHSADNALIEDCEIHNNCNCIVGGMSGNLPICTGGQRPSQISTKHCNAPTFRRCEVYDSYHEGFNIDDDTTNAVVEHCEIYGNPRLQLYLVCSDSATARYNLIYGTDHGTGAGIWIANELAFFDNSPDDPYYGEHTIYGNLVANTVTNIWIGGASSTPIRNMIIYNNIFIEAAGTGFKVESGTGSGHVFKNNIIWQTEDTIANVPSGKVTCDYNLWSSTPDVDVQGANDPPYAVPQLLKTSGWNNLIAGELTGQEFTLQSTSSAINAGTNLGIEYQNALDPTSTWPNNVQTLNQNNYGNWEIGGFVFTGGTLETCQNQGYQCCGSCESNPHPEYDADCAGQVCCGVCYVPDNIIDNGGSGTSFTGTWQVSGGANPYGADSLYSKDNGATYTFTKAIDGQYNISLWWTEWPSRSDNVAVEIYDGVQLLDTVYVNQQNNGGQWNELGIYSFTGTAEVTIISIGNSNSTCADAVKFDLVSTTCGNADTNFDNEIDILEIMAYITEWKAGSVTITDLMIGIGEWKNGC